MRVGWIVRLAVVGVLVCGASCGAGSETTSTSEREQAASGWDRLAASPLSPRFGAVGVWTGDEVLVVGGEAQPWCPPGADCLGPDEPGLTDGAAFDPATGRWRSIAEAPVQVVRADTTVVDGLVYVLVHEARRPGDRAAFLRYDPAADEWTELPLPADDPSWYHLTAASGGVVAFLGSHEAGAGPDLLFDSAAGVWRELPADPLSPSFDRTMVGTHAGLVLFGKEMVPNPGSERPSVARAAVLDVEAGTWERLPDSEILSTGPWHVEGDLLVNPALGGADGGEVGGWGRTYPNGGTLDLASRSWGPLPTPPGPAGNETGQVDAPSAGVVGADTALYWREVGIVLDLVAGEWIEIPRLDDAEEVSDRTVVAAGRSLFVFGGYVWPPGASDGEAVADAWLWTPAR